MTATVVEYFNAVVLIANDLLLKTKKKGKEKNRLESKYQNIQLVLIISRKNEQSLPVWDTGKDPSSFACILFRCAFLFRWAKMS